MTTRFLIAASAVALSAFAAGSANAQTIAASWAGDGFLGSSIGLRLDFAPNTMNGQTFLCTTDGTLHTIAVRVGAVGGAPDLTMNVWGVTNGLPSTLLASQSLPWWAFSSSQYTAFDFDAAQVGLVAGEMYAFTVGVPTPNPAQYGAWYGIGGDSASGYSQGTGLSNYSDGSGWWANGYDYSFVVTVPAPGAAAMFAGVIGLAAGRRRRA